ncbi:hypothetical protein ABZ832_18715 [Streptantibioticus parmotrematis]|uniref:hypothetical protein n=1 Tax=Streptantibioticus parmotrematis TaxID=2873249 RepID=UPI0033F1EA2F
MTRHPFGPEGMAEDDTPRDRAPRDTGRDDSGPRDDHGDDDCGHDPLGAPFGEDELRRLMRNAVGDVDPCPEALERLRRGVPARRARRRQAVVGAAASVLLVGAAVPALLHVTSGGGMDNTGAAHAPGAQGDSSSPGADGGGAPDADGGLLGAPATVTAGPTASPSAAASSAPSSGASDSPSGVAMPPATFVTSPACSRTQLGDGTAQAAAPDQQGRVYGSFRVVNVSHTSCTVSDGGALSVTAQGAADASRIQVVQHTEGDPATELPDPATEPDSVVVPPGQAYQVRFAFVPAPGGGTSGCATDPPPSSGGTGGSGGASGGSGDGTGNGSGATPGDGTGTAGGGAAPTSTPSGEGVAVTDVTTQGGPAPAVTLPSACAGTVYRTEALPVP